MPGSVTHVAAVSQGFIHEFHELHQLNGNFTASCLDAVIHANPDKIQEQHCSQVSRHTDHNENAMCEIAFIISAIRVIRG
jgi:hypothetical protein